MIYDMLFVTGQNLDWRPWHNAVEQNLFQNIDCVTLANTTTKITTKGQNQNGIK